MTKRSAATMAKAAQLPRMDALLEALAAPGEPLPWRREVVKAAARDELDARRAALAEGREPALDLDTVVAATRRRLEAALRPAPRPVINATGVLLHTNLGRAPLGDAAQRAMLEAAGACDLEYDAASGRRGSRFGALRPLLRWVSGAEDGHVVNNGAAALLLACTALGRSRDDAGLREGVVLSRTQMIEIGDGFRIATMAAAGGVPVHEVGATNRSHLRDYEAALEGEGQPRAAAILWAHASNFAQSGFVAQPSLAELAALARRHGVPLIADLGSGSLGGELPAAEPTLPAYLAEGASLVTCSGDKMLGGPQAGLMVGEAALVERCRRFPMARALRPDKTSLAALHASLVAHAREGETELPLHAMVRATMDCLRARGEAILEQLAAFQTRMSLRECEATLGGGALPGDRRPSLALVIEGEAEALAARLRAPQDGGLPVVARIEGACVWLDLRSVPAQRDADLVARLALALDQN